MGLDAVPIVTLVLALMVLWSIYWVVRLAVRHALLDVERGRVQQSVAPQDPRA